MFSTHVQQEGLHELTTMLRLDACDAKGGMQHTPSTHLLESCPHPYYKRFNTMLPKMYVVIVNRLQDAMKTDSKSVWSCKLLARYVPRS